VFFQVLIPGLSDQLILLFSYPYTRDAFLF
jgi:hypothetical protein